MESNSIANTICGSDITHLKIKSIKPTGHKQVYNLHVDHPEHNYILANGLVSKNSHAIAYSVVTYLCAWFKANYTIEFFCALMTQRSKTLQPKDWRLKAPEYVHEAKTLGISINPPSINSSDLDFTIQGGEIFFGLGAISGIGITAARQIMRSRGKHPYKDVYDFIERLTPTRCNSKAFKDLIAAGVFDRMGYYRSELLAEAENLYEWFKSRQDYYERLATNKQRTAENIKLTELVARKKELKYIKSRKTLRDLTEEEEEFLETHAKTRVHRLLAIPEEPPKRPEVARYKEIALSIGDIINQGKAIGCYINNHPADLMHPQVTRIVCSVEGKGRRIAGSVDKVRIHTDKKGKKMMFMEMSDSTGTAEVVIFGSTFSKLLMLDQVPEINDIIVLHGNCQSADPTKFLASYLVDLYRSSNE